MKNETNQMTAPAPVRYYLGDLAYVMGDVWDEVCDLTFPTADDEVEGELQLADGRKFIIYGTAYGDGVYLDNQGNRYGVDSGTLGAIKVEDIWDFEGFNRTLEGGYGHVHEFPAEIDGDDCYSQDGEIGFYRVIIDTADEYPCEDDNEEDA